MNAGPLLAAAGLAAVRALRAYRASTQLRQAGRQHAEKLAEATRAHAAGRFDAALYGYGELLQVAPDEPAALIGVAQIWIDHGINLSDAALALDRVAAAAGNHPRVRAYLIVLRARLDMMAGRYSAAVAALTAIVGELPDPGAEPGPSAWYYLAVCLMETGDEAGAQRAFHVVLAHRPQLVHVWFALGRLLAERDRPAAYRLLEQGRAVLAPPGQADLAARTAAAALLVEAALIALDAPREYDRARHYLDAAAALCPESPYPPVNQLALDEQLGDLNAFQRHAREAMARIRPADQHLIAHLIAAAQASEYGSHLLTVMRDARLIDQIELRRRLATWQQARADRGPAVNNHFYHGIVAGHGASVSGVDFAYTAHAAPAAGVAGTGRQMADDHRGTGHALNINTGDNARIDHVSVNGHIVGRLEDLAGEVGEGDLPRGRQGAALAELGEIRNEVRGRPGFDRAEVRDRLARVRTLVAADPALAAQVDSLAAALGLPTTPGG
ncbi:hypothetical protein Sru01_56020 [Sphaerisporangium rufum]|uniref:Tetratricopeptide repeat protein n=1 Tax=Sphaerisporangium rufum TaxID=1381558 RepID=A0A919R9E7_9ACTN|nr:tetratricopeptide repeat protein [Sphaerisporangium rufum]GII80620.1 hypothetical protein Sru01_56020 [Sphaerisporangium rufum]